MHILDDLKTQVILDKENIYHKIINLPEQIKIAYFDAIINKPKNFVELKFNQIEKIIICGMGGSAISGDIIKSAFENLIPIQVVKDYKIPNLNEKTLIIACSYSGNTAETVSCLKQAIQKTSFIGAVTSGGKIRELVESKYIWINLKKGFPPRSAIGYLFFSVLKLFEEYQIIPNQKETVKSVISNLAKKAGVISNNFPIKTNLAKISAGKIKNKIPIIYSSYPELTPLAYRWKCQINENAKYPCFYNTFPEMNHNEIEGWEVAGFKGIFLPIILSDFNFEEKYKKRVNALKKILCKIDVEYLEFFVEGNNLIEKVFSLIYLGDMISYYLAILQNVSPTAIKFIDFLKNEIE